MDYQRRAASGKPVTRQFKSVGHSLASREALLPIEVVHQELARLRVSIVARRVITRRMVGAEQEAQAEFNSQQPAQFVRQDQCNNFEGTWVQSLQEQQLIEVELIRPFIFIVLYLFND